MLAIIIPYYKITFFEETLKSLSMQNNKEFKLYIGNDCSPDDPVKLIEKYFDFAEINYFNYNINLGKHNLALQWQRIFENVTEEWFHILGDDDVIDENFVKAFYDNLDLLNNVNVIKFSQCLIDESSEILTSFTKYPKISKVYDLWLEKVDFRTRSSLSEHIFRTSTCRKYPFRQYPLAWPTDDMLIFEIGEFKDILFIDDSKVFVRVSSESISGSLDNINTKNYAWYLYYKDILTEYWREIPNCDFRFLSLRFKYYAKLSRIKVNEMFILKKFLAKGNYIEFIKYLIH